MEISEAVEVWTGENLALDTFFNGNESAYQTTKEIALLVDMGIPIVGSYAGALGYDPQKKVVEVQG